MSGLVALSFDFATPGALWLLLLVPASAVLVGVLLRRRTRFPVAYTNLDLLARIAGSRQGSWTRRLPLVLLLLALAFATAALARPHLAYSGADRGALVMIVVDDSGSMQATDIAPSRLAAVVSVMQGLLNALPSGTRVGLIGSSDQAEVLDSPTTDRKQIESSLNVLTAAGGTALSVGVEQAIKVILASARGEGIEPAPGKILPAAVVIGTDGGQNRGTVGVQQAAELAKTEGVRIFGVTVGTPNGMISRGPGLVREEFDVPADPETAALMARTTGGTAFNALDATQLYSIAARLGSGIIHTRERRDVTSWFDLVAAGLLAGGAGLLRLQVIGLP